jgi:hypothetical protein
VHLCGAICSIRYAGGAQALREVLPFAKPRFSSWGHQLRLRVGTAGGSSCQGPRASGPADQFVRKVGRIVRKISRLGGGWGRLGGYYLFMLDRPPLMRQGGACARKAPRSPGRRSVPSGRLAVPNSTSPFPPRAVFATVSQRGQVQASGAILRTSLRHSHLVAVPLRRP